MEQVRGKVFINPEWRTCVLGTRGRRGIWPLILLSTLALVPQGAAELGPMGMVKLYYLGDCLPSTSPILYMADDPAIDIVAVPATVYQSYFTKKEVQKALRLYLPKTYQQLAEGSVILLSDVRADTLSPRWLEWFSRAVDEDGLGLMMIGGILSFGGYADSPTWRTTTIGPLLPVEPIDGEVKSYSWKPVVKAPDDQLMTALPWKSCPHFSGYNKVTLKDGALLLAETSGSDANPFMAFWKVGRGAGFAFCTDWTPAWGEAFMRWDYYPDFTVYSVYYAAGRKVPQDLGLMHLISSARITYRTERDILVSLINLIDRLGGNVRRLEEMISDADAIRKRAGRDYLLQDYAECAKDLQMARDKLKEINQEAAKVRARAFLWIWLIEWLAVSATLMITGLVVWNVMIKRRLYREVTTTRMT